VTHLELLRRRRNFTQADVARLVGIAQSTFGSIERGMRPRRPTVLPALARLFNVPEAEADSLLREILPDEANPAISAPPASAEQS
jgi:transcriptional regulator with XRE-family HTH domain